MWEPTLNICWPMIDSKIFMTREMVSYLQLTYLKVYLCKNSLSTTTAFFTSSNNLGYWTQALLALLWRKIFWETKYCYKMLSLFITLFKSADYITTGLKITLPRRATDPRGHLCNIFLTNLTIHERILNKNLSIASLLTKSFFPFFPNFQIVE